MSNRKRRALGHRLMSMTEDRGFSGRDHQGPSGRHSRGKLGDLKWVGTSRVVDRPSKRKANKRSWMREIARARREHLASKKGESSE